ncbi:AraC family transcriptional regulator [Shouchella patagoniensis]|uniref:AraC family transcriptional regulator n=1 Tax=Shouchella patagoniensis TaxID=228576 RepID=UPI0009958F6A|nr:AraC family transcriptional regulator [Shouchella patagoniensis]
MAMIDVLQETIDYMEKNILEPISMDEIARQANVSPFHFQRLFSVLTNMSVGDYLRKRRLTLAAQELVNSNLKIIDIAFKYHYETPEAFTKAFRKQHGVTPRDVRKGIGKVNAYNRLTIQVNLKGVDPMRYRVVERGEFHVIGTKRTFSIKNNQNTKEIPTMWSDSSKDGTIAKLAQWNDGQIKGLLGVCIDNQVNTAQEEVEYWIATETTGESSEYEKLILPASTWGVFEVHGPAPTSIPKVWRKIFSEWLPSNPYEHAETPELEVYLDEDVFKEDAYAEIWIPLK